MYIIYKATSKTTGKSYIGITNNLDRRKKNHENRANSNAHLNNHFYNAIRKYGFDDFEWTVIEEVKDRQEVLQREQVIIESLDTFRNGYNSTIGGEGNLEPSDELKALWSKQRMGHEHSQETKEKLSQIHKGRPKSQAHKDALKEGAKNRPPVTEETRQKRSKTSKGRVNTKVYVCIDPDGNEYETINGLTSFCEQYKLTTSNMHKVLTGKRNHHKGWTIRKKE